MSVRALDSWVLEANLLGLLKGQHSSLSLTFNDHASNYVGVREAIESGMLDHANWISEEEKQKAIETNRVWCIHWYPDTPVGFYAILASSLAPLLQAAFERQWD